MSNIGENEADRLNGIEPFVVELPPLSETEQKEALDLARRNLDPAFEQEIMQHPSGAVAQAVLASKGNEMAVVQELARMGTTNIPPELQKLVADYVAQMAAKNEAENAALKGVGKDVLEAFAGAVVFNSMAAREANASISISAPTQSASVGEYKGVDFSTMYEDMGEAKATEVAAHLRQKVEEFKKEIDAEVEKLVALGVPREQAKLQASGMLAAAQTQRAELEAATPGEAQKKVDAEHDKQRQAKLAEIESWVAALPPEKQAEARASYMSIYGSSMAVANTEATAVRLEEQRDKVALKNEEARELARMGDREGAKAAAAEADPALDETNILAKRSAELAATATAPEAQVALQRADAAQSGVQASAAEIHEVKLAAGGKEASRDVEADFGAEEPAPAVAARTPTIDAKPLIVAQAKMGALDAAPAAAPPERKLAAQAPSVS